QVTDTARRSRRLQGRPRCPGSAAAVRATRPSWARPRTPSRSRRRAAGAGRRRRARAPRPDGPAFACGCAPPRPCFLPGRRGGLCARNGSGEPWGLAGLPVHGVAAAPAAVLLELDPVGRVPLRFLGLVVAPLAVDAGERNPNSDSGCHVLFSSFRVREE